MINWKITFEDSVDESKEWGGYIHLVGIDIFTDEKVCGVVLTKEAAKQLAEYLLFAACDVDHLYFEEELKVEVATEDNEK